MRRISTYILYLPPSLVLSFYTTSDSPATLYIHEPIFYYILVRALFTQFSKQDSTPSLLVFFFFFDIVVVVVVFFFYYHNSQFRLLLIRARPFFFFFRKKVDMFVRSSYNSYMYRSISKYAKMFNHHSILLSLLT